MYRALILIICCSSIFACKSDGAKDGVRNDNNSSIEQLPITGNWVHEEYYAMVRHHKSPRRAQKSCEVCLVSIPNQIEQPVEIVLNFHEAIKNVIITQSKGQYQLWESENNKPVRLMDSIVVLPNGKIKIGNNKFVNLKSNGSGNGHKVLESLLFKGAYITEDGDEIEFTKDGEVTGLGDYKYYTPVLDYHDIARDVDQIKLGKSKNNMNLFAFKFKKKKFQIYNLECKSEDAEGNCEEVTFGDLVFNLKKAK